LKPVADAGGAEPLVRQCWMLSGEIDFILKCVAPDLKTFQAFVAELTAAPHVRNVKTSLTLRNSKDAAIVPMEDGKPYGWQRRGPRHCAIRQHDAAAGHPFFFRFGGPGAGGMVGQEPPRVVGEAGCGH